MDIIKCLKVYHEDNRINVSTVSVDFSSNYRSMLNCEFLDFITVAINGIKYCLIVDDTSLLKDNPRLMAISSFLYPGLKIYNDFLIAKVNRQGDDFVAIGPKNIMDIKARTGEVLYLD